MTAKGRILVMALGVIAAVLAWNELSEQKEPPPVVSVTPPPQRTLTGRVLDEGGVPVADASVQLFDHAAYWLDGADGACEHSLLACDTIASGKEVLRQLDAGTLRFPEPVARAQTDTNGRFVLPDLGGDRFVVANDSAERAEDGVTLRPQLELISSEGALIVINPFTREISENATAPRQSWAIGVTAEDSTVLAPSSASRRLMTGTAHPFDVKLVPAVDGEFELACEHTRHRARSKQGVLHFEGVLAEACLLSGEAGDFGAWRKALYAADTSAVVNLDPRARVTVKVTPDVAGTVSVYSPAQGLAELGQLPFKEVTFEAGRPKELSLKVQARARIMFKAPGYRRAASDVALLHGLNEVSFELTPARTITGKVPSGAEVAAWDENQWLSTTKSLDGGFWLEVETSGPVRLVAKHASLGSATKVVTGSEPIELQLGDAGVAVEPAVLMGTLQLQGKPMAGLTVSVGEERVTSNASGRFRFEGLAPGPQRVVVSDENGRSFEVDAGAPDLALVIELPP